MLSQRLANIVFSVLVVIACAWFGVLAERFETSGLLARTAHNTAIYPAGARSTVNAAQETGIDAEVIDLRNLDYHGIDWDLIGASIDKTGRVILAEETARSISMSGRWAAEIQERFFDMLDFEILRVTGGLAAPTVSAVLNNAALGSKEGLIAAMTKMSEYA